MKKSNTQSNSKQSILLQVDFITSSICIILEYSNDVTSREGCEEQKSDYLQWHYWLFIQNKHFHF